ncbi:MAG: hypothetical protein COB14_08325 [Alphaproteobacteria bacterium]|nr:MAG: hypothetical protein COB14_08325 [Alphaproteobacteria bacterium]
MCKIFKIMIMVSVFLSCVSTSSQVNAQNYHGGYSKNSTQKPKDKAARPVPKVFSSQTSSVQQGLKLDAIYNNLYVSLWLYAGVNFVHQKKLSAKMRPEKFQLTRYTKEFSGDMTKAMDNLNNGYNDMLADIENAEKQYIEIKEGITAADHEKLDALWKEKITEFTSKAKTYFKLQHHFLNTYRKLVNFILKQSGSYTYKSNEKQVYFYKFGGYKFYGQSIDSLRMTSFKQRKLLRENAPAGVNANFK